MLTNPVVPTGNTTQAAHDYYNWMFSRYYAGFPVDKWNIQWSGPFWIGLFAAILILFFFFYAVHFFNAHRQKHALYGVASFAGAILERIGRLSTFSWFITIVLVLWALFFLVKHIVVGQVY